ncbi:mitochondrial ribosomal protein S18A [Calliopsis andreniformis]|uniref:mitochondrial ribosomal protein S18A n=1 Tax=Calliopsis andreniformis TaxID=337506 RepID=UPI003FCCC286
MSCVKMAGLFRIIRFTGKSLQLPRQNRNISLSASTRLKEIHERKEGNTLIIEAEIKPDKNDERYLKPKNGACPLCSAGLDVKHTDVLILSQFLRSDGEILPRRVTGLCKVQQKRISSLIIMAQKAGLMPNIAPPGSHCDPSRRKKWKKFNTYYDEMTIAARYK